MVVQSHDRRRPEVGAALQGGAAAITTIATLARMHRAAALTCTQAGANPPRRAEVEALFERHGSATGDD